MIPYAVGAAAGMAVRTGHMVSTGITNTINNVCDWFTARKEDIGKAKDAVVAAPGKAVDGLAHGAGVAAGVVTGAVTTTRDKIADFFKDMKADFDRGMKDAQSEFERGRQEGLDGTAQKKAAKAMESARDKVAGVMGVKMPGRSVSTINPDMEDARDPEPIESDGKADGKGTKLEELSGALDEGMADTAKAETKAAASVSKPEPEAPSAHQATVSAELE